MMKFKKYIYEKNNNDALAIIGSFDGVHLGHQKLAKKAKSISLANHKKFIVITFDPSTKIFFDSQQKVITTLEEKIERLKLLLPDEIIVIQFDDDARKTNYQQFHNFLKNHKIVEIVMGNDFKYGFKLEGNIDTLAKEFIVHRLNYETFQNNRVSSSEIKKLITNPNNLQKVNAMLGYNFFIQSEVIHGNKVARKLGYPTINLEINKEKINVAPGIYKGFCKFNKNEYQAAISVGYSPTLLNKREIQTEAYLLNFPYQELYGQKVQLFFEKFLRLEKKFINTNELIKQIGNDIIEIQKNKK